MRRLVLCGVMVAAAAAGGAVHAYSTYASWSSVPVTFFVNPTNADVSASAASTAVQYALNVWNTQSASSFRYTFGGTVSDTATAFDGRNVLIFRNVSNGSTIASTYSWWDSSNHLLDADIIMWDGGFTFFTGTSGCGGVSNAAYIEDIATHELGHALGLNHSTYTDATMYPSYSYCSQSLRTLAPDDIAGAQKLYPATTTSTAKNTAPSVSISSPKTGASFVQGTAISFAASALDQQDGDLSSKVQWTDNGAVLGTGALVTATLNLVGTHTIVASVTDSGGLQAASQVGITITSASASLSATGRKVKGLEKVDLRWSGLTGTSVDVYRSATKVATPSNSGAYSDSLNTRGSGTYVYQVCISGSQTCTNAATVVF